MDVFSVGVITLFAMTALFFIVFFSFIYYWHLKKVTYFVVPLIFTFEFFAIGFLIVSIVTIIIQYAPILVGAAGI